MNSTLEIIRAMEPGLLHVYHQPECEKEWKTPSKNNLASGSIEEINQRKATDSFPKSNITMKEKMCLGTSFTISGGEGPLLKQIYSILLPAE